MTIDIREAYRRALDAFGAHVHRVAAGQWRIPTTCADWDVHTLVDHLVGESLLAPELLAGRPAGEVAHLLDGDLLGDDPVKAFDVAAAAAVRAMDEPDVLTRTVRLSFGDISGEEYISELFADTLIHTWDLAKAIGGDERLDPDLVEVCARWFAGAEESYRQAGVIDERPPLPEDADPQTRLLAAWGRGA
ncbi:TIGR03086 family protein [Sphaerisporangium melleum]|uniref:TIGR03086 family protein n=1 Tax=Sphaerisporangium melleum TaxID=321316 RepID=A0A917RRM8_9ACTN|nr:TIGR03086 family metal-binding protein [Sphaerisporangium melleum]GGL19974.1 TIGR03086 family protein [Sphaerisporangium melleum]GII74894.1 TIGR03086 family protein [Sphaerisporangium melleum]